MLEDALRIARQYRPSEVRGLEMQSSNRSGPANPSRTAKPGENLLKEARDCEERSDYSGAVQSYLRCEMPRNSPNF